MGNAKAVKGKIPHLMPRLILVIAPLKISVALDSSEFMTDITPWLDPA